MSTISADHDLTRRDPFAGNCPMERLADRMADAPKPKWLKVYAWRNPSGECEFTISGTVSSVGSLVDVVNFLGRVIG